MSYISFNLVEHPQRHDLSFPSHQDLNPLPVTIHTRTAYYCTCSLKGRDQSHIILFTVQVFFWKDLI